MKIKIVNINLKNNYFVAHCNNFHHLSLASTLLIYFLIWINYGVAETGARKSNAVITLS